ncbi:MAG: tryptophanase [Bacillota bacterium]
MYIKGKAPFKIKVVEPIKWNTRAKREQIIRDAHYCFAYVPAEEIPINLLTDSGTSAMSQEQWAGMMRGDESYYGARNWYNFEKAVQDYTGFKYVLPAHQGRAAEHVVCRALIKKPGGTAYANAHFGTTEAHVRLLGANPVNLPVPEALDPEVPADFKGNINLEAFKKAIKEKGEDNIPFLNMVLVNNFTAGQPVSMANLKEASKLARENGIKVVVDAARVPENAFFIKEREAGYGNKSIREICNEIFSYADVMHMSAKKSALVNIGGFVATDDESLYEEMGQWLIMFDGFITYGGLSGRDLEAVAIGLSEGLDYDYLAHRVGQVEYLGNLLRERGVPIYEPTGGHGVYVNGEKVYPHIPKEEFAAHALSVETFIESGVYAAENPSSLGWSRTDPETGKYTPPPFELLRFAIPRRVYTDSQLEYTADGVKAAMDKGKQVKGFRFIWKPDNEFLRIFYYKLERL